MPCKARGFEVRIEQDGPHPRGLLRLALGDGLVSYLKDEHPNWLDALVVEYLIPAQDLRLTRECCGAKRLVGQAAA